MIEINYFFGLPNFSEIRDIINSTYSNTHNVLNFNDKFSGKSGYTLSICLDDIERSTINIDVYSDNSYISDDEIRYYISTKDSENEIAVNIMTAIKNKTTNLLYCEVDRPISKQDCVTATFKLDDGIEVLSLNDRLKRLYSWCDELGNVELTK